MWKTEYIKQNSCYTISGSETLERMSFFSPGEIEMGFVVSTNTIIYHL